MCDPQWLIDFKTANQLFGGIYADLQPTIKTLHAGLILWNGNQLAVTARMISNQDIWWGLGQLRGIRPPMDPVFIIKYFSVDIDAAKGYALSCRSQEMGWLHEFKLTKPIQVLDIGTVEHLDWDEMVDLCQLAYKHGIKGIFVNWGTAKGEISLCNWISELEYIASAQCIGAGKLTPFYDARCAIKSIKKLRRSSRLASKKKKQKQPKTSIVKRKRAKK